MLNRTPSSLSVSWLSDERDLFKAHRSNKSLEVRVELLPCLKKGMFHIKKLILFLSLVATILITVACSVGKSSGTNAFELLERANTVMSNIDGMSIVFSLETAIPMAGFGDEMIVENKTTGTMEVANVEPTTFEASVSLIQVLTGMTEGFEYVAYFRDNALYIDLTEEMGVGMRSVTEMTSAFSLLNANLGFSEDDVLNQSVEETDEGRQLSFSLNSEKLLETINAQLNVPDLELENLREAAYNMTILLGENDIILSIELDIQLVYELDGEESEISMHTNLEVIQEENITIEFPDELDGFLDFGVIYLPAF